MLILTLKSLTCSSNFFQALNNALKFLDGMRTIGTAFLFQDPALELWNHSLAQKSYLEMLTSFWRSMCISIEESFTQDYLPVVFTAKYENPIMA